MKIPPELLDDLPDVLRIADTGRTLRKMAIVELDDAELRLLWYERRYMTADGAEHTAAVWPFIVDTFYFSRPQMAHSRLPSRSG